MSKKNIAKIEHLDGKTHVTFDTSDGKQKTYVYEGSSARAVKRGTDPAKLVGRLVEPKKAK